MKGNLPIIFKAIYNIHTESTDVCSDLLYRFNVGAICERTKDVYIKCNNCPLFKKNNSGNVKQWLHKL